MQCDGYRSLRLCFKDGFLRRTPQDFILHAAGARSVPVEQSKHTSIYLRVCKKEPCAMMVASEVGDYRLLGVALDQGLKELGYSSKKLNMELPASDKQQVLDLFCSRGQPCCYKVY